MGSKRDSADGRQMKTRSPVARPLVNGAALIVAMLAGSVGSAREVRVSDAASLREAISGAVGGDVIVLAAGTYRLTSTLPCRANGSASRRIVMRAETPFAARIDSDTLVAVSVTGAYWTFEGLHLRGICADDSECEHAFHVTAGATDVVLRNNRLVDFNAQIKVNAVAEAPGRARIPHRGLIEANEVFDTRPRNLRDRGNSVNKININTGDDWVVRENYIHGWWNNGGNYVSHGVYMKSGGRRGIMERNLVICATPDVPLQRWSDSRIGMSFGGGGTASQYCAPAFDSNVQCGVEHEDGIMRNNIVVNCSDAGIYVNRGRNTRVLHNTLIATGGIDFRFDTTTGIAVGNLISGGIRARDGATFKGSANFTHVTTGSFEGWYAKPLQGDLSLRGDVSRLIGRAPPAALVTDDFCGRPRPVGGILTHGALEHSLGDCGTSKNAR